MAAIFAFVFVAVGSMVAVAFWPAVIAVILNLPLPGAERFLLVAGAIWAYWMLTSLQTARRGIERRLARQEYWIRQIIVSLHDRGEAERLSSGYEEGSGPVHAYDVFGAKEEGIVELAIFLASIVVFGLFLHYGVFGSFEQGWLTRLTAR
jgi:hypothetical protein